MVAAMLMMKAVLPRAPKTRQFWRPQRMSFMVVLISRLIVRSPRGFGLRQMLLRQRFLGGSTSSFVPLGEINLNH
jgi:hypothetical protein